MNKPRLTNNLEKLDEAGSYYSDGLVLLPVIKQSKLIEVLNTLMDEPPRENYFWEKSMNSYALRPQAYDYGDCILDFLFDNELPEKIKKYTERDLILSHIQITKTDPGRSYQDWHRDTYQYSSNSWIGNTPPAHKIIFYPEFKQPEPRLKFVRGSHRFMLNNSSFDESVIKSFDNEIVMSCNNQVLLFETSLLHAVIPDSYDYGSIRIIYNFITETQYVRSYSSKDHHKKLHDLYLERLGKRL